MQTNPLFTPISCSKDLEILSGGLAGQQQLSTRLYIFEISFSNSFSPHFLSNTSAFLFSKYAAIFSKTAFCLFPTAFPSSVQEVFFSKKSSPIHSTGTPIIKKSFPTASKAFLHTIQENFPQHLFSYFQYSSSPQIARESSGGATDG